MPTNLKSVLTILMFIIIISYLYYDYNHHEFHNIKRKKNVYSHSIFNDSRQLKSLYYLLPIIVIKSYQVLRYDIIIKVYIYTKVRVINNFHIHDIPMLYLYIAHVFCDCVYILYLEIEWIFSLSTSKLSLQYINSVEKYFSFFNFIKAFFTIR